MGLGLGNGIQAKVRLGNEIFAPSCSQTSRGILRISNDGDDRIGGGRESEPKNDPLVANERQKGKKQQQRFKNYSDRQLLFVRQNWHFFLLKPRD